MASVPRQITESTIAKDPVKQAYQLLHIAFVIAPLIAGLDKFADILVNWDQYLSPAFAALSPLALHPTMMVVGIIEIVAGVLVAIKPRYFAYVVMFWLWGIILNLFLIPGYFDIALRDFGLSLGALALARLSVIYDA